MRILLAEDEVYLAKAVVKLLERSGYPTDSVTNGRDALTAICSGCYDAAVLDVMMPQLDGVSVVKRVREMGNSMPILLLTAKAEAEDKIKGLDSGANDYLTKPFDTQELLARIRRMLRDSRIPDNVLQMQSVTLNRESLVLASPTGSFQLTSREYRLMEFLLINPSQIFTKNRLLEKIWGENGGEPQTVQVYIAYLRRKLKALHADICISEITGQGYRLEPLAGGSQ